ncbi:hypothetical protein Bca52824_017232 [Brassica carinata]|uniref:Uncharacterized protein n=1 Tax=Brassica carinata TaxID=52824 RepID=A0A8X8AW14_BRACI|nr:hypothetical protein Bca52824_017232 [Brassica carinata]
MKMRCVSSDGFKFRRLSGGSSRRIGNPPLRPGGGRRRRLQGTIRRNWNAIEETGVCEIGTAKARDDWSHIDCQVMKCCRHVDKPSTRFLCSRASPLLTQNRTKDVSSIQVHLPVQTAEPRTRVVDSRKSKITQFFVYLYEKLKLKQIIQPAIIASILAMVLGAIPFTKKLFFTNGAPLFFFTDSCMILGTRKFKTWFQDNSGDYIRRLVLVPPVGLGIVTLADRLGFLPAGDKMFKLCCYYSTQCLPLCSQVLLQTLEAVGENRLLCSSVHIFAIFSMAGWMVLYINILF